MRKETVDISILVTSTKCDIKIMQSIRITSRLTSNINRNDLSWPHLDDEPRVQEKHQVNDQQSGIFILVACLTIPSSN